MRDTQWLTQTLQVFPKYAALKNSVKLTKGRLCLSFILINFKA